MSEIHWSYPYEEVLVKVHHHAIDLPDLVNGEDLEKRGLGTGRALYHVFRDLHPEVHRVMKPMVNFHLHHWLEDWVMECLVLHLLRNHPSPVQRVVISPNLTESLILSLD